MEKIFTAGCRTSPLAFKQVEEVFVKVRRFYPDFKAQIVGIETYGDKDKNTSISQIEGSDFFTREIDQALLEGKIDFAVHSAKDLPDILSDGLFICAITESIDPFDVLVSKGNPTLTELERGARIGTSSKRRKSQLKDYRKDFQIVDIRGNIQERLSLLYNTDLDGIVIAAAGLMRLGLEHVIAQRIPFEILRPHPLQGCLAIVVKEKNNELIELFSELDARKKYVH